MKHPRTWFVPGRTIAVSDKMQRRYKYKLTYKAGTHIREHGFKPKYTPQQMLSMGVFEGKYLNDCVDEFPMEWFKASKNKRSDVANTSLNYFKLKSRLSLGEWRHRGWVPVHKQDPDIRGWFHWYCRYWVGRRIPIVDAIQIKRWKAFARHSGQVKKNAAGDLTKRRRQRQALLQWSWDCMV